MVLSVILDRMSYPARGWRWPAGQRDLVVCHHPYELKDCCLSERSSEHVVDAEGLARRGRRDGAVHNVRELLLQLQIVQNEAVAVVGYARLFVVQSPKRGVYPVQEAAAISREEAVGDSNLTDGWRRSADAGTFPGLP